MYRLVIVSGPNRGSSFALSEGDHQIGRAETNQIVLSSSRVSKEHCLIRVDHHGVEVIDEKSTNGTFLNGALLKKSKVQPGDKISVGDFVLELVQTIATKPSAMPTLSVSGTSALQPLLQEVPVDLAKPMAMATKHEIEITSKDPAEKAQAFFEGKVMPTFYGFLMKTDYTTIIAILMFALSLVGVFSSVVPALDLADRSIRREAFLRAKVLARETADRNLMSIANRNESQINLSLLESEESVRLAVIVNPDLQIIAPQSKVNQILASGKEAAFAIAMSKQFREGRERGEGAFLSDTLVAYIEPIKVIDPQGIKNVMAGMVLVSIDFSDNLIRAGGTGVVLGTALVLTLAIAILFYLVIMRMTFKPFEVLNDELDQVLRGVLPRVTQEFKMSSLNNLFENINSVIQKANLNEGSSNDSPGLHSEVDWNAEMASASALADLTKCGFFGCDPQLNVVSMNSTFEEMSGMRNELGPVPVAQIARDQAFASLVSDLYDRVSSSFQNNVSDEFEFSGIPYSVMAMKILKSGKTGLALFFKAKE